MNKVKCQKINLNSFGWYLLYFFSYPFSKVKIYGYKNIDFKIILLTPFLSSYSKVLLILTFANIWTCVQTPYAKPHFSQEECKLHNLSSLNVCLSNHCSLYLQHCINRFFLGDCNKIPVPFYHCVPPFLYIFRYSQFSGKGW